MKIHELKSWPIYFNPVIDGEKKFEIRRNDRNFECGDLLHLHEFEPNFEPGKIGTYTGRECVVVVVYIMYGQTDTIHGLLPGHAIMSIEPIMFKDSKSARWNRI